MKPLSDIELGALDRELYSEVTGKRGPECLHLREEAKDGHGCFPVEGYLSWQHRWFMGTGVRPTDW